MQVFRHCTDRAEWFNILLCFGNCLLPACAVSGSDARIIDRHPACIRTSAFRLSESTHTAYEHTMLIACKAWPNHRAGIHTVETRRNVHGMSVGARALTGSTLLDLCAKRPRLAERSFWSHARAQEGYHRCHMLSLGLSAMRNMQEVCRSLFYRLPDTVPARYL